MLGVDAHQRLVKALLIYMEPMIDDPNFFIRHKELCGQLHTLCAKPEHCSDGAVGASISATTALAQCDTVKKMLATVPSETLSGYVFDLSNENLNDFAVKVFAQNTLQMQYERRVISIHLSNNHFGDEGLIALSRAFSQGAVSYLQELILMNNDFGHRGFDSLARAIDERKLSNLKILNLGHTGLNGEGLKALCTSLEKGRLSNLKLLNLSHNAFDIADFTQIAQLLSTTEALKHLRVLRLVNTHLCDVGVGLLCDAFARNTKLGITHLILKGNRRLAKGAETIANVLMIPNVLQILEFISLSLSAKIPEQLISVCLKRNIELDISA